MALSDAPLREARIMRLGSRQALILGCDRRLIILSLILIAMFVWGQSTVWSAVVSAILYPFLLWAFRAMAKADPMMFDVATRAMLYKRFYPAKSTPWNPSNKIYHSYGFKEK